MAADRRVVLPSRMVGVDVGSAYAAELDIDHDAVVRRFGLGEFHELQLLLAGDQCSVHA